MIIFKRYYNQIKPFFRQIYFSNLTFCSPLVTGELLQNMVDVTSVTYQVNSIEIYRQPVLLNTKNYLQTGQAKRNNENIVTSQIQE